MGGPWGQKGASLWAILAQEGHHSLLAAAVGKDFKGKLSTLLYLIAIPLAFVHQWIAGALYVIVALIWLIPDRASRRECRKARTTSLHDDLG